MDVLGLFQVHASAADLGSNVLRWLLPVVGNLVAPGVGHWSLDEGPASV